VVLTGDINKKYVKGAGFEKVIEIAEDDDLNVDIIAFGLEEIVRSPATAMWAEAFDKRD